MHDRSQFWSPVPDWPGVSLQGSAVTLTPVNVGTAWLVSGDATAFLVRSQILQIHGPRQVCSGDAYALRLAPDRLLVIDAASSDAPSTIALTGDSFANCAVTEISDGLIVFDILGDSAAELIAQGSEYRFDDTAQRPLESASMNFGGFRVIVSRRANGWRLHVPPSVCGVC